ncbi:phage N-6-adenine-methyltransferase [Escherichia coli]|nr:phage N-6-adenine-methyltransferase [Escherichia coli]
MSNKYCQALVELRNKPAHELKEVGDQWRTPDNIFWGINTLFGPFVLDLFTDGDNAKCAAYYTAEDNALAHDWSERLAELKGAAFGNPPYSRASQHEGQYITGMRYIMKHASAMRDKGGRYVFLIKAATSEVWWPEDADHIAFIRGRIGFELPAWFIPKDEKQVPTGAFFAGAIAVFDKTWKGPAISYIGRDELEACGEAFEHLEPYGFTARANSGAEAVVLFPDGDRSHAVVVTVSDRRYRLKGLQTGEVAVYDDQGQSVTLTREGIVVDGAGKTITFRNSPKARFEMDLEVTGQVKDLCDSSGTTMSAMRLAYNGHRHRENGQGSNTDKPDKAMEA